MAPRLDPLAVKIALLRKGKTARAIAAQLGLPETTLSSRIVGARPVHPDFVEKFAQAIGVDASELLLPESAPSRTAPAPHPVTPLAGGAVPALDLADAAGSLLAPVDGMMALVK